MKLVPGYLEKHKWSQFHMKLYTWCKVMVLNIHWNISVLGAIILTTGCVYTFCGIIHTQNSYFGRHAIFSESSGSRLGDPGLKALQTTIKPTLFVDFCLIPLSNTCSLSDQPGTWTEKYFSIVKRDFVLVSLAVWATRPCWIIGHCVSTSDGPDFVTKDRHCSKSSHWKLKMSMRKCFFISLTWKIING